MPIPIRQRSPTILKNLFWLATDDGSRSLWDETLGESYHSGCGAIAESYHVYLRNSGVEQRLNSRTPTRVVEYGFGTGTTFILTAAVAHLNQCPLEYWALEISLLPCSLLADVGTAESLERLAAHDTCLSVYGDALLEAVRLMQGRIVECLIASDAPATCKTRPHVKQLRLSPYVTIALRIGDACSFKRFSDEKKSVGPTEFPQVEKDESVHAVFFDPFSPTSNPELWTPEVFQHTYDMLQPKGTLTSYCVQGKVRRGLQATGYRVRKVPGPAGGKREVLLAYRDD